MEKRKTFKVVVPFINKEFIVEDWTDYMAVDRVLDTMLTREEQAILSRHILVDCEVEEISSDELN